MGCETVIVHRKYREFVSNRGREIHYFSHKAMPWYKTANHNSGVGTSFSRSLQFQVSSGTRHFSVVKFHRSNIGSVADAPHSAVWQSSTQCPVTLPKPAEKHTNTIGPPHTLHVLNGFLWFVFTQDSRETESAITSTLKVSNVWKNICKTTKWAKWDVSRFSSGYGRHKSLKYHLCSAFNVESQCKTTTEWNCLQDVVTM